MTNVITSSKVTTNLSNNKCTQLPLFTITTIQTVEVNSPNLEFQSGPLCNQVKSKLRSELKSIIRISLHLRIRPGLSLHLNWVRRQRIYKIWKIRTISTHQWLLTKEFLRALITFPKMLVHRVPLTSNNKWTNNITSSITLTCQTKIIKWINTKT